MRDALSQFQSSFVTVLATFPRTLIGSLKTFFKSFASVAVVHLAVEVIFRKISARPWVIMLQKLPELIIGTE